MHRNATEALDAAADAAARATLTQWLDQFTRRGAAAGAVDALLVQNAHDAAMRYHALRDHAEEVATLTRRRLRDFLTYASKELASSG